MATYVFRVRFALDPRGVRVDPDEFETVVRYPAPEPGTDGWRFFERWLWHGELTDERHFRERVEGWLGVEVRAVSFAELVADRAYLDAWEDAVAADLAAFNADSVRAVKHSHLGSSIRVLEGE